ncbi:tRNA dihydrouridine(20/20a) synthase DusA [Coralloluteibacterium stylophorae]|uniref:tRNA-dihydrouridine(20/20a) synthase n=1 Tax=Coralloluteibacterium stylophorae TaxID=1776034 RepID=A0A8J8AWG9_9GAMM|nr:tRNA dihydrouridine(20/20a) synthase DusA [Coralloluteibacterium stylophorae]MBS7458213.1 tRNA dihydrouridine(20/20a) synthase DusA [Coralloluteibacterium stylophorae]
MTASVPAAASSSASPGWMLCVAPMIDVTDRHCRRFHRELAPAARLYTEMVHAQAVLRGDRARLLGHDPAEHPLALQLGGSAPADLAAAARVGADLGYDEINLNVGCPSDRVQAGRFGACLMREPALVADCVAAMRAAVPADVPVTVKCRLGVDEQDDYEVFRAFVDTVAAGGCTVFVVHARNAWLKGLSPKENREIPPLRYDWAYRLKRERPALTVVLNGGIARVEDVRAHLGHVDGVMLGRVAWHEPYRLAGIQQALFGTEPPTREAVLRRLEPYLRARAAHGDPVAALVKPLLGLFHGETGGRAFRRVLSENAHRSADAAALVAMAVEATRRHAAAGA